MKIAIIGGGLCGLVSAFRLSSDHNITIYEKSAEIGGLLSSYHREKYSIEKYYHHFFSGDTHFLILLNELHLSDTVTWLKGSTGTYQGGSIYPLTTPLEILRYPHLSLYEKLRLALFTKKVHKFNLSELDNVTAQAFLTEQLGNKIYHSFFRPLLNSKFGKNAEQVSAAWLVSRIAIRSDRGLAGERLGYLDHGFAPFIRILSDAINRLGGEIRMSTPVTRLNYQDGIWYVNDIPYDTVISTIAPGLLRDLGLDIPDIPYQGAACLTLGLERTVTKGVYWINLYDEAPYGAVIGHTCFAPLSWYGEHIVYLASYFTGTPDPELKEKMIQDFCNKFKVRSDEITWAEIAIDPFAGPLYLSGYKEKMQSCAIPGMFLAGMFSEENYPERSIEGSVRAGFRVAREVTERLQKGEIQSE